MFDILNGKKAAQYIFFEMLPSFLLGMVVFISIILMFQMLKLTEFVLSHGVEFSTIFSILGYVTVSMLPALLPMSLLFAVLLTYGRLSQDSEIVAMKASGIHMATILLPALCFAIIVSVFSAQMSFNVGPWGNRQFELLYSRIGASNAGVALKEGTFSEGFFDKVVYVGKVNSETGDLQNIFIYDEDSSDVPLTIIARKGKISTIGPIGAQNITLNLLDGDIHRQNETHTKIKFDTYNIQLNNQGPVSDREKSMQSLTLQEIKDRLNGVSSSDELKKEDRTKLQAEFHKRWSISILCIIFAMIGVGLGTTTNKRAASSGGITLSIGIIVLYWILYVSAEGLARTGQVPVAIAIWAPNFLFGFYALNTLRKNWN